MTKAINPSFEFEEKLWSGGYDVVAGSDEVGRGSFAGPVVAAAVAFPKFSMFQLPINDNDGQKVVVRDSKTLSERQRLIAEKWIKENAIYWKVGEASVGEINKKGISAATFSAFRRAAGVVDLGCKNSIQFLLVDAFNIPNLRVNNASKKRAENVGSMMKSTSRQLAVKKGDQLSFSISAASIVAKVYRDKLMERLGKEEKYLHFQWHKNKGYGTKVHREAIVIYGSSRHHRIQFVETFLKKQRW